MHVNRKLRDQAKEEAKRRFESGTHAEAAKAESDALKSFLAVRVAVAEALEHDALARVISGSADDNSELGALNQRADERVTALLRRPVSSLRDLSEVLAIELKDQGISKQDHLTVAPLTYGTTTFSSEFGRQTAADLEQALVAAAQATGPARSLAVKGTYLESGGALRVIVLVRDSTSGTAVASAEGTVPKSAIPASLAIVPQNLQQALIDQKILGANETVSGALRVELWTSKGHSNLVYTNKEEMRLYLRVNKPAYVRLVYLLAGNGLRVPINQAFFIDQAKVNLAVEYPDGFEISPPFGIEQISAVAFTERPEPLMTKKVNVGGEDYDVVIDDTASLVKHRGIKIKKAGAETSDALLTLTTLAR